MIHSQILKYSTIFLIVCVCLGLFSPFLAFARPDISDAYDYNYEYDYEDHSHSGSIFDNPIVNYLFYLGIILLFYKLKILKTISGIVIGALLLAGLIELLKPVIGKVYSIITIAIIGYGAIFLFYRKRKN